MLKPSDCIKFRKFQYLVKNLQKKNTSLMKVYKTFVSLQQFSLGRVWRNTVFQYDPFKLRGKEAGVDVVSFKAAPIQV